jgi:hypothetical protein
MKIMELIKEIFEDHSGSFITELEMIGFSSIKAKAFLVELSASILDLEQHHNIAQTVNKLISRNPAQILKSLDTDSIAAELCIDKRLANKAIIRIEPLLSRLMRHRKENIVDIISELAWGPQGQPRRILKDIFYSKQFI